MFRLFKKAAKKKQVEQEPECSNVSIEDSSPVVYQEPIEDTDYMRFFFKQERENKDLKQIIKTNLKTMELSELQEIALEIMNMSFLFFRRCSEYHLTHDLEDDKFSHTVYLFLSDNVKNIPSHLNEQALLNVYLGEFFTFIHTFFDINDLPIKGHGNFVYYELSHFAKEWQHLYKTA